MAVAQDWKRIDTESEDRPLLTAEPDCHIDEVPGFIEQVGSLPTECANCFKGLIFWDGHYSRDHVTHFKRMLLTLPFGLVGKYNDAVAVFYFTNREAVLTFQEVVGAALRVADVRGHTQWRLSGKYWQDEYPQFFRSAKEFDPEFVPTTSFGEWFGV